ncbi:CotH kinase family protein [Oribacterium sp. FC2011]|uniref:CotH kinase family protein n=1 Tax=Oribacterium sp. FC2011 TaxID=1408311 RepID=UPI0004E12DEA|nr:CotH kinase family protein [Oribacterium sp. FC2011]
MKKDTLLKNTFFIICLLGSVMSFSACTKPTASYEKASTESLMEVKDNNVLYETAMAEPVLYLTVGWENDRKNTGYYSWTDINSHDISWYETNDEDIHYCEALVQFGDETGPSSTSFGYGDLTPNATVRLIGHKASKRPQKSYKVKINSGSGNVSGVKNFNLKKCFGDPFRFLNKLSNELIRDIDPLLSARTEFVHLYVKDNSLEGNQLFVDYGLYTMTESVNKRYLTNRNLNSSGELYDVENFDFRRHEDVIVQPTDSRYDQKKFEQLLEAEGSNDYSKLIRMLDALNDDSKDIESIVNSYFNEDNLYSFMALNILMDNKDTDTEKFYLYSPVGSEKFYFIPGDMDGSLRADYRLVRDQDYSAGWEKGIFIFNDSVLFSKILKNRNCINKLSEYVKKLHNSVLSPDNVSEKAVELSKTVKPFLFSPPDMKFARVSEEEYGTLISEIPLQMEDNYYSYNDSLLTPWPFHIKEPTILDDDTITLNWEESFILDSNLTYDVTLSDSWGFNNILVSKTGLTKTSLNINSLEPGQYFLKVVAKSDNSYGLEQEAYEYYNTETKKTIHGVMCFYVMDNGSIKALTYK